MNDTEVAAWRGAVRRGDLPDDLVELLRNVAVRMVRQRLLPPSFAPYGQWNEEAAEEIFASWYADRLVGGDQLLALLDRASSLAGLRGLAQRSLRQHLLNAADRSQARNLFGRVVHLLRTSPMFTVAVSATRAAETWFALSPPRGAGADTRLWSDPDRLLIAHGWATGDLPIIRYRANAEKLSPVVNAAELERFVEDLMYRTQAALTPTLLMVALSARLDLGALPTEDIDESPQLATAAPAPDVQVALADTARAILADLTPRQREVLRLGDAKVASVAEALRCSVGTVMNERRRIGVAVSRLSEDDYERDALLNIAADLLYPTDNG